MAKKTKNNSLKIEEPRINGEIRGYTMARVVYQEKNGVKSPDDFSTIMSVYDGVGKARELGLDLVEINQNAAPPVLRICDYSKYFYELKKRAKQMSKSKNEVKEIQLTTNIGRNDMEVKAKKAAEFIEDGDKVKVVLKMRKREAERIEESKRCLYEFMLMLNDVATPESMPKDEGQRSIVILKKKK